MFVISSIEKTFVKEDLFAIQEMERFLIGSPCQQTPELRTARHFLSLMDRCAFVSRG